MMKHGLEEGVSSGHQGPVAVLHVQEGDGHSAVQHSLL